MIPFFDIKFDSETQDAAISALNNEKLVLGESVFKFEEEFARYIGTKFAISVNSGTSALQLSLLALGIGTNSKVVTSTNSFISSANSILLSGAQPVLSDIYSKDGNMDLTNFNEKVNAIIPVHIYGNPCELDRVQAISESQKIPIIEDAAQAHGALFNGKKIGGLGITGCFSFYPTKNMTVGGDGGMVTTNDEEIATQISSFRDNGRKTRDEHDQLGSTMRLNSINAAIGRVQLKNLDDYNSRRRAIANIYRKNLPEECLLEENPNGKSVYHQFVIKSKNRNHIMDHLKKFGIGTMIHYPIPIHKQPLYANYNFDLPTSVEFSQEIFSLPSYPLLTDDQVCLICEKINEVM